MLLTTTSFWINFPNQIHFNNQAIAVTTGVLAQKITEIVLEYFGIIKGLCLASYGLKELLFDRIKNSVNNHNNCLSHQKQFINEFLLKTEPVLKCIGFHALHGSLYIASGLSSAVAASQQLFQKSLGIPLPLFPILGNSFFLLANLFSLKYHVHLYQEAAKVTKDSPQEEQDSAKILKKSAVLGILNSLSYLMIPLFSILGISLALSLLFGCIAVFTGCIKILYDYFYIN